MVNCWLYRVTKWLTVGCSGRCGAADGPGGMEGARLHDGRQPARAAGGEQLRHALPQVSRSVPEGVLATRREGAGGGGESEQWLRVLHRPGLSGMGFPHGPPRRLKGGIELLMGGVEGLKESGG